MSAHIGLPVTVLAAALGSAPAAAQPALITDIDWHMIEAYCLFWREDHAFDYDDAASWRFVFFSQVDSNETHGSETAFISLRHQLRELERVDGERSETGERWEFWTYGAWPHKVVLSVTAAAAG